MTNRFRDFDAFFEEKDGPKEPFMIRLFGKEWTLPDDAAADQILRLQRVRSSSLQLAIKTKADLAATLTDAEVAEFKDSLGGFDIKKEAHELLGEDNVTAWLKDHKLPYKKLTSIFWWAVSVHEGSVSASDGPGEPKAPKGAAQKATRAKVARAKTARRKKTSRSSSTGGRSKPTSTASTG
jgi:hypothetical protein